MDCTMGHSVALERMPVCPCSGHDASLISCKGVRAVDNDYNVSNRISGEFVHSISFRLAFSNRNPAYKTITSNMEPFWPTADTSLQAHVQRLQCRYPYYESYWKVVLEETVCLIQSYLLRG
ncbi:hypothetical protein KC356_g321 [Hortaea werneckii]|nr:hypothetical protein KC356_g321 [Hortaea werneckii]